MTIGTVSIAAIHTSLCNKRTDPVHGMQDQNQRFVCKTEQNLTKYVNFGAIITLVFTHLETDLLHSAASCIHS